MRVPPQNKFEGAIQTMAALLTQRTNNKTKGWPCILPPAPTDFIARIQDG